MCQYQSTAYSLSIIDIPKLLVHVFKVRGVVFYVFYLIMMKLE